MARLGRLSRSVKLGLIVLALLAPVLAWAQVGIFVSRPAIPCSTADARYAVPVAGQTFCFDSVSNTLKVWNGTTWVSIGLTSSGTNPNVVNVIDYGAKCDGVTDDAAAFRSIATTAASSGISTVLIPATLTGCNIGSVVIWPRGVALEGVGAPAQNSNSPSSFINHSASGVYTVFQVDGSGTGNPGGGYLFRNFTIRQTAGTGTNTSGVGTGLKIACTSTSTRATWVRIENVNFEEQTQGGASTTDPWTTTIDLDGSGCYGLGVAGTIRDVWITNSRIHNGATAGTPNSIKLNFAVNVFLMNLELTGAGGNLLCSGIAGSLTSSVNATFIQATTMALDFCQNFAEFGGQYVTITNTANTAGANILMPLTVTNGFTNNAVTTTILTRFNTSQGFWQFSNGIILPNGQSILGTQTPGPTINSLIQLGVANKVNIDASALGVAFGGGIQTQSNGIQAGSPTGGDRGTGTYNGASSVIMNGVVMLKSTGTPTCINNCGGTPTVTGNDTAFNITLGTTLQNSFVVRFATAYAAAPACVAAQNGAPQATATVASVNTTSTGVTVNLVGAPANGTIYSGICHGVSAG